MCHQSKYEGFSRKNVVLISFRSSQDNMYRSLSSATLNNKALQRQLQLGLIKCLQGNNAVLNATSSARNLSQNLPRLPVPQLKLTLDKYLKSVKPFLSEKEYAATTDLVGKFAGENGQKLQDFLVEKAKSTENWLADWWLNAAYLDFRSPVVVWSSPGLVFPFQNFQTEQDRLVYTAKLILAAVDYKLQIDSDKIPLDKMGKDPLDMNQYKKVFGTCRIPGMTRDSLEFHPNSKHIVVVHNNHYFKVDMYDDKDHVVSKRQLVAILNGIMELSVNPVEPVGTLTSENRDDWGKVYAHLIKDANNKKSVREIQKSLFVVCLDGPMANSSESRQTIASKQFIHGGGSMGNVGNRWFDKTVQFIIGQNGSVGLTYEHSPSEGQPIAVMVDYMVDYIEGQSFKNIADADYKKQPQRLTFNVDGELKDAIEAAGRNVDKMVHELDMDCFTFKSFGKEFVKSHKLSPDSFIQMAMQYAFYRLHKTPAAHYESAATRKYIHGRTETIRSCSIESVAFAKAMLDDKSNDDAKVSALKAAINSHKQYSVEAVNGFGVDRHLLGLKLSAMEQELSVPSLYQDVSYLRGSHMRISSSQVATKCDGFMCYGPLVDDGYGCCYNPRANDMNFAISAIKSNPKTNASSFRQALETSLMDMHNLLVKTQKHKL